MKTEIAICNFFFNEREMLDAHAVRSQRLRHAHTCLVLVVLHEAAKCTLSGAQSRVKHVAKLLLFARLGETMLGVHGAGLVVVAIAARNKLAVLTLA